MAFKLAVDSGKGFICEYWRIYRIDNINFNTGKICGWLAGYISKEIRKSNIDAILMTEEWSGEVPDAIEGDIRDFIYACLKQSNMVQDVNEDGTPKVDGDGNPVMIEKNKWASAEAT